MYTEKIPHRRKWKWEISKRETAVLSRKGSLPEIQPGWSNELLPVYLTENELAWWRVFGFCLSLYNIAVKFRATGWMMERTSRKDKIYIGAGGGKEGCLRTLTDVYSQSPSASIGGSERRRRIPAARNYPAKLSSETATRARTRIASPLGF